MAKKNTSLVKKNRHFKHIHTPTQTPAITETKRIYDLP